MPVGLLGRKIGMTQVYIETDGALTPVTVIEAGPCQVLKVRTKDKDGYEAVQLGFADKPRRLASRSERGQVTNLGGKNQKKREAAGVATAQKEGVEPKRFIKEFRTDGENVSYEFGQVLKVDSIQHLKFVDVIGTSKGRGFAGHIKRNNFSGQGAAHGTKRVHRRPGSIGASADPSHTLRGTRMAGHMGHARVTVRRLEVVQIDPEKNLLLVKGAIPGPNGGYVIIRQTSKKVRADYK